MSAVLQMRNLRLGEAVTRAQDQTAGQGLNLLDPEAPSFSSLLSAGAAAPE